MPHSMAFYLVCFATRARVDQSVYLRAHELYDPGLSSRQSSFLFLIGPGAIQSPIQ